MNQPAFVLSSTDFYKQVHELGFLELIWRQVYGAQRSENT